MKTLACIAALLVGTCAHAQDAQSWARDAGKAYDACAFRMSSAQMFGDDAHYQATRTCVDQQLSKAKASFPSALAGNSGARSARLKDYYAAWVASMSALTTLQVGTKNNADRAYADAKTRMQELWARYEIEQ